MRNTERPPFDVDRATGPGDVDELLRAFFRAEMPDPWPELKFPAAEGPVERPVRPRLRSRLLLAASVAFLFVTSLALSGSFRDKERAAGHAAGNATASPPFRLPVDDKARGNVPHLGGDRERELPGPPPR